MDTPFPDWLTNLMTESNVSLWGAADLRDFTTLKDEAGNSFPSAISFAIPIRPEIMVHVQNGPTRDYADEYLRVNSRIKDLSDMLAGEIRQKGFRALPLAASKRTDPVNIKGDFPHKTAATRAGLGWIGRHCQLVTRPFGSWVRLGTVFTDLELPCGPPIEQDFCGQCTKCVEACPTKALTGKKWYAGLVRKELLDAVACDKWKVNNYSQYLNGRACGICSAVCPFGLKVLKKKTADI